MIHFSIFLFQNLVHDFVNVSESEVSLSRLEKTESNSKENFFIIWFDIVRNGEPLGREFISPGFLIQQSDIEDTWEMFKVVLQGLLATIYGIAVISNLNPPHRLPVRKLDFLQLLTRFFRHFAKKICFQI